MRESGQRDFRTDPRRFAHGDEDGVRVAHAGLFQLFAISAIF
jgi:hypothetical protein